MTTTTTCPVCGVPVPQHTGKRGRPSVYCSYRCRRVAEGKLRRLARALDVLDDDIRQWERHAAGVETLATPQAIAKAEAKLAFVRAQRDAAESEYAALVSGGDDEDG